jgi:hypothetical protein
MKIHPKIFPFSIKVLVICLISLLYLGRAFNEIKPYPSGDGVEYVITTEAFYNHLSPNLKADDIRSFQNAITKKPKWTEAGCKMDIFEGVKAELEYYNRGSRRNPFSGFYPDKSGNYYSYHFFFYSLINVPGRWIADLVNGNPLRAFQVTNAFLVIIVCGLLIFCSPFSLWVSVFISIIFCFSSTYWYLGWIHPEVFTSCLTTIGLWFFFQKKYHTGIFLVALAALQNQPLIILLVFLGLYVLYLKGLHYKVFLKLILSGGIALWPPIFFYSHFNTTNLIKDAGFLSTDVVTLTRVFGFYFDLNQGLILVAPLLLPVYIILLLKKTALTITKKTAFDPAILLPLFILIISCIISTMQNWNHGQAVINRYATYISAIIFVHSMFLIHEIRNKTFKYVLFNYIIITQIFTILYHEKFNYRDYLCNEHKPIAKYILGHHPALYNPDAHIFAKRTLGPFSDEILESPIIYAKGNIEITKILIREDMMDSLKNMGFKNEEILKIKDKLFFQNGWAYMNKGDYNLNMNPEYLPKVLHRRKLVILQKTIDRIKSTPEWLEMEKEKALKSNMPLQQILEIDAEYLYNEEQRSKSL